MARQINEELYQYITDTCLESYDAPSSPLQLLEKIWKNPDFPMHCPEHHYLVPAVLLTTYCRLKNDGKAKLREELNLAGDRAKTCSPDSAVGTEPAVRPLEAVCSFR